MKRKNRRDILKPKCYLFFDIFYTLLLLNSTQFCEYIFYSLNYFKGYQDSSLILPHSSADFYPYFTLPLLSIYHLTILQMQYLIRKFYRAWAVGYDDDNLIPA